MPAADTALNYSTHAIEELEHRLRHFRRIGMNEAARALECLLAVMREAEKFVLPNHGRRLPYDAVCLEAPFPMDGTTVPVYDSEDGFKEHASTRRISVAWTHRLQERFPPLCPMGKPGFYVTSVYFDDAEQFWIPAAMLSFIPENPIVEKAPTLPTKGFAGKENEFLLRTGVIKPTNTSFECHTRMLLPEMVYQLAGDLGSVDDALARLSIDLRDETASAISFCLTANASNVTRHKLEAPVKLNKRRTLSGRAPFYDAWELDVQPRPATSSASLSPRDYLRKGLLLRQSADSITYVPRDASD
jgi:hypothetical protein